MPLDDQELVECCSHPTKTKTFSFLTEKRIYIYIYKKKKLTWNLTGKVLEIEPP